MEAGAPHPSALRLRAALREPPCRRGRPRSGRCCPNKVPAAGAPRQPARPRRLPTALLLSPRRAAVGGGRRRHGAVQAQGAAPQVGVAGEAGEAAAGGAGGGAAARGDTAASALARRYRSVTEVADEGLAGGAGGAAGRGAGGSISGGFSVKVLLVAFGPDTKLIEVREQEGSAVLL